MGGQPARRDVLHARVTARDRVRAPIDPVLKPLAADPIRVALAERRRAQAAPGESRGGSSSPTPRRSRRPRRSSAADRRSRLCGIWNGPNSPPRARSAPAERPLAAVVLFGRAERPDGIECVGERRLAGLGEALRRVDDVERVEQGLLGPSQVCAERAVLPLGHATSVLVDSDHRHIQARDGTRVVLLTLSKRENRLQRGGFRSGRYWARTSDLRLVEAALSQLS